MNNEISMKHCSSFELLAYYASLAADTTSAPVKVAEEVTHYLMFYAAGEGFVINIEDVDSIFRETPTIKALPFAPKWLKGLSSVRNEIVSVISFSALWQQEQATTGKNYILLRGKMKGFMLEVGDLAGIKDMDIESIKCEKRFIDGYFVTKEMTWQRINMNALLLAGLTKTEMDF